MAKQLSDLRSHARVYLDEISAADWSDAQVDRELNYAYMETYAAVVETFEAYYREQFEADVEANQQEYALPSDFWKMQRLEITYKSTEDRVKAQPYNFEQNRRTVATTNFGVASRPLYDITGSFLRFLPIPTEDVTKGIRAWYIKTISEMSDDDDTIDIPFPDRYGRLIVLGACAQLLRKGQQEEAVAAKYQEDFQIGLEKMKQELEDRNIDGNKRIIDTLGDWNDFSYTPPFTAIYG